MNNKGYMVPILYKKQTSKRFTMNLSAASRGVSSIPPCGRGITPRFTMNLSLAGRGVSSIPPCGRGITPRFTMNLSVAGRGTSSIPPCGRGITPPVHNEPLCGKPQSIFDTALRAGYYTPVHNKNKTAGRFL